MSGMMAEAVSSPGAQTTPKYLKAKTCLCACICHRCLGLLQLEPDQVCPHGRSLHLAPGAAGSQLYRIDAALTTARQLPCTPAPCQQFGHPASQSVAGQSQSPIVWSTCDASMYGPDVWTFMINLRSRWGLEGPAVCKAACICLPQTQHVAA